MRKTFQVELREPMAGRVAFPVEADRLRVTDSGHAVFLNWANEAEQMRGDVAGPTEVVLAIGPDVYVSIDGRQSPSSDVVWSEGAKKEPDA